jgi:hypothetical protein
MADFPILEVTIEDLSSADIPQTSDDSPYRASNRKDRPG